MNTKLSAILMVLFSTLLTSTAQLFLKLSVKTLKFGALSILTNYYLIMGFLFYAIAGILMIIAFRHGEVTVLYPIFATSYVWVSFSSHFILGEEITTFRWFGVILIVLGVSLLGLNIKMKNLEVKS